MAFRNYISAFSRRLRLGWLADGCRYLYVKATRWYANRNFARQHPGFAFPPDYALYETYTLSYKDYYEDGRQTAAEIIDLVMPYLDLAAGGKTILDWGCGPGRVVRHIPAAAGSSNLVVGCDYNAAFVEWCSSRLPGIRFVKNELEPPLPLNDATADLIYGLSIFTHLSPQGHTAWAAELYRVLKPGGVLVLTMQGNSSIYKLLPDELRRYEAGQLVVRSYSREGHRLYSAFQPPALIQQLFHRFTVLQHLAGGTPGGLDAVQDTWVFRKPDTV